MDQRRISGAADGRSRDTGLKHAVLRNAVHAIHSATRHQPHGESRRGAGGIETAAVRIHIGVIIAVLPPAPPLDVPRIAPSDASGI
jgi:hypothetical protein